MPQDAFHIRRFCLELDSLLTGGKVNRISQADKDEVTLIIYTGKSTVKLILSTNASFARVCLSETEKEPAPVAPNFCMLLRKHLLGGEILGIRQYGYERIVEISFRSVSDFSESVKVLRAEIMGKYSNLILTENDVILGALKTTSLIDDARRILFAGAKYAYPEPQDKLSPFDSEKIGKRLQEYRAFRTSFDREEEGRFIFDNVAGFALSTANELAKKRPEHIPTEQFIGECFQNEPCNACVVTSPSTGEPTDFFSFPVTGAKGAPSLLKAADIFYRAKEGKKLFSEKRTRAESVLRNLKKKQAKKLQETVARLEAAEGAEEYKIKGELLTANLYRLEKGMKECVLENWYSEACEPIKITLDATLSPSGNAQRYFKTYAKLKRTKEALEPRKRAEEAEMQYIESIAVAVKNADSVLDFKEIEEELISLGLVKPTKTKAVGKKREEQSSFREYEYGGFRIRAGRNNLQNDRLLKDSAPHDLWLHTQKYHSSHVLISTEGRSVPDDVLAYAAGICAWYSDGREGDKIPVDYCLKKFVKKPPKSPAGFVTYTDYKTLLIQPKNGE